MKHSFSILNVKSKSLKGTINSEWIGSDGVKESWEIILQMIIDKSNDEKLYNSISNKIKEFRKDITNFSEVKDEE